MVARGSGQTFQVDDMRENFVQKVRDILLISSTRYQLRTPVQVPEPENDAVTTHGAVLSTVVVTAGGGAAAASACGTHSCIEGLDVIDIIGMI